MNRFNQPSSHRTPLFTQTTHLGISKHDLERDSGFSDASSEYHSTVEVTDSEDAARNGSIVSQEPTGPQVAVMGGSYTGLSPMIIMNNFVLKQPSSLAPTEKQWSFPSPLEIMPQSQVVLLQPMVSNDNNSSPKTGSENTRQSKSYMPILKSYPRIAPHPVDTPSKRVGSSRVRGSTAAAYDQRQRRHHSHRVYSSPSPVSTVPTTAQTTSIFELSTVPTTAQTTSIFETPTNQAQAAESQEQLSKMSFSSQVEMSSVPSFTDEFRIVTEDNGMLADEYQDEHSVHSNKLKRFSNTYNILNKSGLLGITMRTKQLIKENKRTQNELQQLQEQTTLLLEALSSGNPQLWTKLQLSLQDTEKEQWGAKAQSILA